ncbi:1-phosphatidylinositol-3-phosphate 5-kinase FAB1A [Platanthera zijinensis]|uniref:1-phosphatidylinositol-3-phosphate 5-kinase FAB1A n=1 Tax=Platanthera zijinensis TaxID=2320716 RepID=A0AAP0BWP8_9ASPA
MESSSAVGSYVGREFLSKPEMEIFSPHRRQEAPGSSGLKPKFVLALEGLFCLCCRPACRDISNHEVFRVFMPGNKYKISAPESDRAEGNSEDLLLLVSLFRELEHQGGARLLLPVGVEGTVILIFDDEPTRSPPCLAKILGIYQVIIKYVKGGKDWRMDVLVWENLLFARNITRLYDLKGSSRSRYNLDCNGNNEVLLDQNLIEAMLLLFLLEIKQSGYWKELSGIIHPFLPPWINMGERFGHSPGAKNVSPMAFLPEQYKERFRKAMLAYFLVPEEQKFLIGPILMVPAYVIKSEAKLAALSSHGFDIAKLQADLDFITEENEVQAVFLVAAVI